MQQEIRLLHSPKHPWRAAFAYCRRSWWGRFIVAGALLVAWIWWKFVQNPNPDWVDGVILAMLYFYFACFPVAFLRLYKIAKQKRKLMEGSEATLIVDSEFFTFKSGLGTSTLSWKAVNRIWKFKDFWLFVFFDKSYSTIPLAGVTAEQRQFLIDCVEKHGGKVS